MLIDEFDYDLPPDRIAQEPARDRDGSSMLILDPSKGPCRDFEVVSFSHFPEYLAPGDAVVFNDTKVIPARLFARKERRTDGGMRSSAMRNGCVRATGSG